VPSSCEAERGCEVRDAMTSNSLALLAVTTLLSISPARAAAQEALVGALREQDAIEGCSWSASSPDVGEGFVFLAERDESVIIMNIGGVDVRLSLDSSSDAGSLSRVGDRLTKVYTAASTRVEARFTATWICPPDQEGCEVTRFIVTFHVRRGNEAQTVEAVGAVGC
jgi:hypothetical protein